MQTTNTTEQQIIDAAKKIFMQKGLAGARMQDIADEAGINKAMLHYYYRSKDKLFDMVFQEAMENLLKRINVIFKGEMAFEEKVAAAVDHYITFLSGNPHLPVFIINEINQNPDRIVERFVHAPDFPDIKQFMKEMLVEMEKGTIRKMNPMQLMMNMLSMCIFPFVARPLISNVFGMNDQQYSALMEERKKSVTEFILMSLRP
ncbi:TetR/AcrR family transcriptional regulator [Chitinophaga niabensis]|uniref:Regulatory protein, tetR family n=1 Tax=Chitinophaga niabensis TaxID=536979 RepID=A0A1N6FDC5_9BACT|nr:TetR family transcriptional regulator [Chitinophaga niabensis]SIN93257.1 regulatory protein, tetR family [Chitinophaga niabensis]